MNVLFLSVEVSPLSKVGGLADVAGSLPKALARRGHDVRIITPYHRNLSLGDYRPEPVVQAVPVWQGQTASYSQVSLNGIPVYLVENDTYFDRTQIYGEADDLERWLFFCDAVLALATSLEWRPEVMHMNEWHTGFVATRLLDSSEHPWRDTSRVFTIHNLGFPGVFDSDFVTKHALVERALRSPVEGVSIESGTAQGIVWSDMVNTVSPTYSREILTEEYGAGLDPLLRLRNDRLVGILNGIDYEEFNPATDPRIAATFDAASLDKRAANKEALQRQMGLAVAPDVPLVGMVSRLFWQKGIDLAYEALSTLLQEEKLDLVVLGTGDEDHQSLLRELQERHPGSVAVSFAFDPVLAQLIYAGADMFLMPSRFEPCGLGQLIAQRYGAVPVVRRTGGLADTVEDAGPDAKQGTGFVFDAATPEALRQALQRALDVYRDPKQWRELIQRGMAKDFSWGTAAGEYEALYEQALRMVSER